MPLVYFRSNFYFYWEIRQPKKITATHSKLDFLFFHSYALFYSQLRMVIRSAGARGWVDISSFLGDFLSKTINM